MRNLASFLVCAVALPLSLGCGGGTPPTDVDRKEPISDASGKNKDQPAGGGGIPAGAGGGTVLAQLVADPESVSLPAGVMQDTRKITIKNEGLASVTITRIISGHWLDDDHDAAVSPDEFNPGHPQAGLVEILSQSCAPPSGPVQLAPGASCDITIKMRVQQVDDKLSDAVGVMNGDTLLLGVRVFKM